MATAAPTKPPLADSLTELQLHIAELLWYDPASDSTDPGINKLYDAANLQPSAGAAHLAATAALAVLLAHDRGNDGDTGNHLGEQYTFGPEIIDDAPPAGAVANIPTHCDPRN